MLNPAVIEFIKSSFKESGAIALPISEGQENGVELHLELLVPKNVPTRQILNIYIFKEGGNYEEGESAARDRFHGLLITKLQKEFPGIIIPKTQDGGTTEKIIFPSPHDEIAQQDAMLDKMIAALQATYQAYQQSIVGEVTMTQSADTPTKKSDLPKS